MIRVRHKMEQVCTESTSYDGIEVTSRLMNIILEMPLEQQLDLLEKLDTNGYNGTRKYTRTVLKNPWLVMVDQEDREATDPNHIKDIGRCGMFIETDRDFAVGEKVTMRFRTPASDRAFKIMGRVVRFQENGIGVKFLKQLSRTE